MDEKQFHIGVKAMIVNSEGKVLLMHEDVSKHSLPIKEYWDFPGGRIQEGETVLQTLAREMEEETGITDIGDPEFETAVISNHQIKLSNDLTVGLALMLYKVKIADDVIIKIDKNEHHGYEWVDIEEARKRLADKYPKEFTEAL